MRLTSLQLLRCPYCDTDFEVGDVYHKDRDDIVYGCINCECSEYPIVDGILIIMLGHRSRYIIDLLRSGSLRQALAVSLAGYMEQVCTLVAFLASKGPCGRLIGELVMSLAKVQAGRAYQRYSDQGVSFCDLMGASSYDTYLKHRFSEQSLWSLYSLIPLLKTSHERVLDLCCGVGHTSFVISEHVKPKLLVCADRAFRSLYLARRFFARDAQYVCLDADHPLPFRDGIFTSILASDAMHYVVGRANLIQEAQRVLTHDGVFVGLHVHNSLVPNIGAGLPIAPQQWIGLFKHLPARAFPESSVVEDLMVRDVLDLAKEYSQHEIDSSNAIVLIATRNQASTFRSFANASRDLVGQKDNLVINPIYSMKREGTGIVLHMRLPNQSFEQEFPLLDTYMPQTCVIERRLANALSARKVDLSLVGDSHSVVEEVERLILSFALVNVPPKYI